MNTGPTVVYVWIDTNPVVAAGIRSSRAEDKTTMKTRTAGRGADEADARYKE